MLLPRLLVVQVHVSNFKPEFKFKFKLGVASLSRSIECVKGYLMPLPDSNTAKCTLPTGFMLR